MKWFKRLEVIEEVVTSVLFLVAILISLYGVFMRYVMHNPKYGLAEITTICMTWAIFIGFGRALKANQHIAVELVFDRLPKMAKRIVGTISNLLGAGYCLYLALGGTNLVAVSKMDGYVTNTDHIPIWITYFILPVGMYLLCIYFLWKTFRAIIGDPKELISSFDQEMESYISESEAQIDANQGVSL